MQDEDPNLPGFFKNPSRSSQGETGGGGEVLLAADTDAFLEDEEEGVAEDASDAELGGLDSDIDKFLEEIGDGDEEDGSPYRCFCQRLGL